MLQVVQGQWVEGLGWRPEPPGRRTGWCGQRGPEGDGIRFTGPMPEGATVRFMRVEVPHVIEAAGTAARALAGLRGARPDLTLLVSCHGRQRVLQAKLAEELRRVRGLLGARSVPTGLYP